MAPAAEEAAAAEEERPESVAAVVAVAAAAKLIQSESESSEDAPWATALGGAEQRLRMRTHTRVERNLEASVHMK